MTSTRNIDVSGKMKAPSLEGAVGWLNVAKPLTMEELRGKVVLLDFWTYCCINCMHVIPDLKRLEKKYPQELVVIGVHSAKFANEKDSSNIREAILRYGIEHPVANDANFEIWQKYAVHAWPTLVLIDPDGKVVGSVSGEGVYDTLDEAIGALVSKFGDRISRKPIALALEKDKAPETTLSFPGKVTADAAGKRLFIADTNHNRIIMTDLDGKAIAIAGSGEEGSADGPFDKAQFHHPQGMVLDGDRLYVADTENHLLRRLDLRSRTVETVAGDGRQAHTWIGGPGTKTSLNSPWDVTMLERSRDIYIAMAGSHQIWVYHPDSKTVEPFAGSGVENIVDGSLATAALAQPSGITTDGTNIYFADSEVSGLRMIEMAGARRKVKTLIGKGLFEFGDRDGVFENALLQHPLGVAWYEGRVYVADSYNHKIKVADVGGRRIATLAGTGKPGMGTGETLELAEPGGVSVANGKVYVADTNNNAIRVIDIAQKTFMTLAVDTSTATAGTEEKTEFVIGPHAQTVDTGGKALPASGEVAVKVELPEGLHLNPDAKPVVQLRATGGGGEQWVGKPFTPEVADGAIKFKVSTGSVKAPAKLEASITYYYCRSGAGASCYIGAAVVLGPVKEGSGTVEVSVPVRK